MENRNKLSGYYNSPVIVWITYMYMSIVKSILSKLNCVKCSFVAEQCSVSHTALNVFNVQSMRSFHFRMLNRLNLLFNQFLLVKPVISAQGWGEFNQTCQGHLGDTCLGGVILSGLIFPLSLNNSEEDFPWIFVGSLILIMNFYSPGAKSV